MLQYMLKQLYIANKRIGYFPVIAPPSITSNFFGETNPEFPLQHWDEIKKKLVGSIPG